MNSYNIVLWISLAMLALTLAIWVHQRMAAARVRAERARRVADRGELGGDSYFLPPAPIEQAVELANPVEIENLLAGESETVAAAARQQLEAATDISITGGLRELSLSIGTPAPVPSPARRIEPDRQPAAVPGQPPGPRITPFAAPSQPSALRVTPSIVPSQSPGLRAVPAPVPSPPPALRAASPTMPSPTPGPRSAPPVVPRAASAPAAAAAAPVDNQFRIPVRDLVLAWFEARGYRASVAFKDAHPIELILHHRKDQERTYAFVVERAFVTSAKTSSLLTHARASGVPRLLIAAEAGAEAELPKRVQRHGIRLFDEAGIRAQLAKIDIRVAAKIIAVARGRALARRTAAAAAAAHARQPERSAEPLPAAKF